MQAHRAANRPAPLTATATSPLDAPAPAATSILVTGDLEAKLSAATDQLHTATDTIKTLEAQLAKKVMQAPAFVNMKRMLTKKNDLLARYRSRLATLDPSFNPADDA